MIVESRQHERVVRRREIGIRDFCAPLLFSLRNLAAARSAAEWKGYPLLKRLQAGCDPSGSQLDPAGFDPVHLEQDSGKTLDRKVLQQFLADLMNVNCSVLT